MHASPINAYEIVDRLREIHVGGCVAEEARFGSRRADLLVQEASGKTTIFEVKVTLQDFRRDTIARVQNLIEYVDRMVYVAPAGVIREKDIPAECGFWEYQDGELSVVRAAPEIPPVRDLPKSALVDKPLARVQRSGVTPLRAFRVTDEQWNAVTAYASREGVTNTEALRRAISSFFGV